MKTRPIMYSQTAYLHPRFCAFCGKNDREFYVDLGLDIDTVFNAGLGGVIYICNVCLPGAINDLIAIDETHQRETAPTVESSYDEFSRFGRGSELPDVPTDAPGGDLSDGISGDRSIQTVDSETDLRDDSVSDSSSEDSGPDDSTDEPDSTTEQPSSVSGLVFDLLGRNS